MKGYPLSVLGLSAAIGLGLAISVPQPGSGRRYRQLNTLKRIKN